MPFLRKAISIMEKSRKRMIEDRKAVRDAIRRALALDDKEEVNRLTPHLNWLDIEIERAKK